MQLIQNRPKVLLAFTLQILASSPASADAPEHPGHEVVARKIYQSPTLNDAVADSIWKIWEPEYRSRAEYATAEERRKMVRERYGLIEAPFDNSNVPMGFTRSASGSWHMTCVLCHGGRIMGAPKVGTPNIFLDLTTLSEDIYLTSLLLQGKSLPPRPIDLGGWQNKSSGTTNAMVFSAHYLSFRDQDLNALERPVDLGSLRGGDLDAPPWWNVRLKKWFYSDGFVAASPRALMQFTLNPANPGPLVRSWLPDFESAYQWLSTLQPPKYPGPIDPGLAYKGREIFKRTCMGCHGDPSPGGAYPNRRIPLEVVGTDPERLQGITPEFREHYGKSWLADYRSENVVTRPDGYVAPPLHGIWASAPYFHNGSVPTLSQVLAPATRPKIWKIKAGGGYDHQRVGLEVEEFEEIPASVAHTFERRRYFDTRVRSKGNGGHLFAASLSEEERKALLEYLKSI